MLEYCRAAGLKRVAVLYINQSVGLWLNDYFKSQFGAQGGNVVASESFQPDAVDLRTQLVKIRSASPEALYILAYKQGGLAMKQARELGLECRFLGTTDFELPDVSSVAGPAAEGAVYTKAAFAAAAAGESVTSFVARYTQRFGETPEVFAATAYDAVRIIAAAYSKVGVDPDRAKAYVLGLRDYAGISGTTTFLPNGDVSKPVELRKITGGAPAPLE
jgi:branched-chain amino acid transport system substrate-binding protein